jgi:hypothetical protein
MRMRRKSDFLSFSFLLLRMALLILGDLSWGGICFYGGYCGLRAQPTCMSQVGGWCSVHLIRCTVLPRLGCVDASKSCQCKMNVLFFLFWGKGDGLGCLRGRGAQRADAGLFGSCTSGSFLLLFGYIPRCGKRIRLCIGMGGGERFILFCFVFLT